MNIHSKLQIGSRLLVALAFTCIPLFGSGQPKSESKTFILVHGSWHSAWNWYKVKPLLEREGHRVFALDMPGMGRDKTPIANVKLHTTVKKICDLIDSIPGKVILLGHSKNGVIISQVAEYRPDKIEKLIYLAAVLIPNGKTAREYFLMDKEEVLGPYVRRNDATKSSALDAAIYKEGLYHDCDDEITEMAKIILSHEPMESATTPLHLTEANYGRVPRYYIECTEDRAITPSLQVKMYTEMPCKEVYKMKAGHSPFFSMPKELVEIIIEISGKNEG